METAVRSRPDWLSVHQGTAPLVLAFPHCGSLVPPEVEGSLMSPDLARSQTTWSLRAVHSFAEAMGATLIASRICPAVIDLDEDPFFSCPPNGRLCPARTPLGEALYWPTQEPDHAEIARRKQRYFAPYHDAIVEELDRLRTLHSNVILYTVRGNPPWTPSPYGTRAPTFVVNTNGETSTSERVGRMIEDALQAARGVDPSWTLLVEGGAASGWTTAHYGQPTAGIHAFQLTIDCTILRDPSCVRGAPRMDETAAARMAQALERLFRPLLDWAEEA